MDRVKKILWAGIPLSLAGVALIGFVLMERDFQRKAADLENLLKEAQQREEKAVVVLHVSKQMEEIAYQQKEISDKQRKEAELQAAENFRMKLRVEEEWKKAVKAQQEALAAYRFADKQKALAEARLHQAEYAKSVADTLAYLALGRSLGSLSITQYKTGNYETAVLLAYSAWNFVERYRGDTFLPAVFNALSLCAGQSFVWHNHKGGITSIIFHRGGDKANHYYTVSKYGEILHWTEEGQGSYSAKVVFADPQFDFRAACLLPPDTLCALSYDGKLVKLFHEDYRMIPLAGKGYVQMIPLKERLLLLSADGQLASVGPTGKQEPFGEIPEISCVERTGSCLLVGRKNGDFIRISFSGAENVSRKNFHQSPVTALGYCPESRRFAIGYADGMLLLFDERGEKCQRLIGHHSAITRLILRGKKLYSIGYDRTLRLWNLASEERLEAVVILESNSWLHSLELNREKETLLAGDENGNLYSLSVSPDNMAAGIKENLQRNFTREEWAYYIGSQIPYESYTSKESDL